MATDDPPAIYSGAWLRTRSDDDLQIIRDGSYPTSQAFEGASGELARRAAERSEKRQLRWIKITLMASVILGIAGIGATLLAA